MDDINRRIAEAKGWKKGSTGYWSPPDGKSYHPCLEEDLPFTRERGWTLDTLEELLLDGWEVYPAGHVLGEDGWLFMVLKRHESLSFGGDTLSEAIWRAWLAMKEEE